MYKAVKRVPRLTITGVFQVFFGLKMHIRKLKMEARNMTIKPVTIIFIGSL
jgi:hypothetical protein